MTFKEWWENFWEPTESFASVNLKDIARTAWEAAQPKMQPMHTAPRRTDNFILLLVDGKYIECFWDNVARQWQTFSEWGIMDISDPKGWLPMPVPPQEAEK